MASLDTYALTLPSGSRVVVRKPDPVAIFSGDKLLFPLLSLAVSVTAPAEEGEFGVDEAKEKEKRDRAPLDVLRGYCEACLVEPAMPSQIKFHQIPYTDATAIYLWATSGAGDATPYETRPYLRNDMTGIVNGQGALLLDLVCNRYGQRPSVLLCVEDAEFAFDLDAAVAFRANRRDCDAQNPDKDVEVEDGFGETHKIPQSWLPAGQIPRGAKVTPIESYAKTYGDVPLSVGGLEGDAQLAPMPSAENPRWGVT